MRNLILILNKNKVINKTTHLIKIQVLDHNKKLCMEIYQIFN